MVGRRGAVLTEGAGCGVFRLKLEDGAPLAGGGPTVTLGQGVDGGQEGSRGERFTPLTVQGNEQLRPCRPTLANVKDQV